MVAPGAPTAGLRSQKLLDNPPKSKNPERADVKKWRSPLPPLFEACLNPSAGEPSSITSYIQSLEETSPLLTGTASTLTDYICDLIEEGSAAAPPITSLTSYVEAVEAELPEEIEPSVSVPGSSLSSYIENVEDLEDVSIIDDKALVNDLGLSAHDVAAFRGPAIEGQEMDYSHMSPPRMAARRCAPRPR